MFLDTRRAEHRWSSSKYWIRRIQGEILESFKKYAKGDGVLGVECSNHSVPTIFFKGLRDFISRPLFVFKCFYPYKTTGSWWNLQLIPRPEFVHKKYVNASSQSLGLWGNDGSLQLNCSSSGMPRCRIASASMMLWRPRKILRP